MITLSEDVKQQIWEHGTATYPYEGCGLLLGALGDNGAVVQAIFVCDNVWPDKEESKVRFKIDEEQWLAAELAAMGDGYDIIGVYHSHPDHPAVASPRDLAWAAFSGYSYLITEIREGEPVVSRSWQLNADHSAFTEEDVVIVEG